jgi:hypothetical protein
MKTEHEIRKAIEDMRNFNNTEVFRSLFTEEGKTIMLDRIRTLQWVLEELKELSTISSNKKNSPVPVDSSNKPSTIKLMPKNKPKISLDTIKQIKDMALKNWTNVNIGKKLNISPQLVNYWRKNTPKDING